MYTCSVTPVPAITCNRKAAGPLLNVEADGAVVTVGMCGQSLLHFTQPPLRVPTYLIVDEEVNSEEPLLVYVVATTVKS